MKPKKQTGSDVSAKDVFVTEVILLPVVIPQPMSSSQSLPKFSSAAIPLPEVPIPASKDDLPPPKSKYGENPGKNVELKYNLRIGKPGDYAYINPYIINWHPVPDIPPYELQYGLVWVRTNMQRIPGPQSFEYSVVTTEGISETNSVEISAQLGVEVKFLNASLTATFGREISVSREHSITNTYRIDVPAEKFGVWILWQLFEEFAAIGENKEPVRWSGYITNHFVSMNASLAAPVVVTGNPIYTPQLTLFDI